MPSIRETIKISGLLLATLATVALLSQPGASQDEWFHASSIWCGHGEREVYCPETVRVNEGIAEVKTNFSVTGCSAQPKYPLVCASSEQGITSTANAGIRPGLFYFVLSWVVVPSVNVSLLLARLLNAVLVSIFLGFLMWLLPRRYRAALFLTCLVVLPVTGSFLLSSVNPESWNALGTGIGWLAVHAAITCGSLPKRQRIALAAVGVVAVTMAVGSSWDSIPMLLFVFVLVGIQIVSTIRASSRLRIFLQCQFLIGTGVLLAEASSGPSPLGTLTSFLRYLWDQPNSVTSMAASALQKVPSVLDALGTVPTMNSLILPELVYVSGVLIFGLVMFKGLDSQSMWQKIGLTSIAVFSALLLVRQDMVFDFRAMHTIDPLYTFPLLIFAVAWWQLMGPFDLFKRVSSSLNLIIGLATATFLFTQFTVVERFTDRQSYGIRMVPDGPDDWWWPWMPISPTISVVLATYFFWRYLQTAKSFVAATNDVQIS